MSKLIDGFSKLSKSEKIDWITKTHFKFPEKARDQLIAYWNKNASLQNSHDEFVENTLTNFYMPFGVAPNFVINDCVYTLPMVIEESSVIAAACNSAKFWSKRGGFSSKIISTEKVGHVHFFFKGDKDDLFHFFELHKSDLLDVTSSLTKNMKARGGGISNIDLRDKTEDLEHYFQLHVTFQTVDAMGANFINSCLEQLAKSLKELAQGYDGLSNENDIEIAMSILSNYVPNCLVRAQAICPIDKMGSHEGMPAEIFVQKFIRAVQIAEQEPYRAVTHNKGIMNGVDAVAIATGNDFRAIEAGVHAYASRLQRYKSLSSAYLDKDQFVFEITLPLALATVGGLTQLHPMVAWSLELLGCPSAEDLMQITAVAGLAQNFAALRSLVTSGIQKGHMKMHLLNILNQQKATEKQKIKAVEFFKTHTVSVKAVRDFLNTDVDNRI